MPYADRVADTLALPSGEWEWASDSVYVHVGPMIGLTGSEPVHNAVFSRAVRQSPVTIASA